MNTPVVKSNLRRIRFISGIGLLCGIVFLFWLFRQPPQQTAADENQETYYHDGRLRSRTEMAEGVPHGRSDGFYTNGQLQVTEYFTNGISHGLRTKWASSGEKKSEAEIVDGQVHGRFRRWHLNGQMAEDAGFSNGIPDGVSYAYHEDGSMKAEVTMRQGNIVTKQYWDEGEKYR